MKKNKKKSAKKPTKKSARKIVKKSVKKSIKKSARKSVRKTVKKSARKSVRKTIKKSARKSVRKTVKKSAVKKKIIKNYQQKKESQKKVFKNKKKFTKKKIQKEKIILKIIRFQEKLKPNFNFNFNLSNIIETKVQAFFDNIAEKIEEYKITKQEEKRRRKIEELEAIEKEKILLQKKKKEEVELGTKIKEKALKDEIRLEKERVKDIKLFLRQEQALVRKEQAEKQKQFLKQLQIEKQIEKFRIREVKELEKLEKISLKEKREDYTGLQERINKLKEKYRVIRDQKIRERVEALGVQIQGDEDRETLLQKERDYTIARQKIELSLESFYRSASSLVFQLNKRHITRQMSIFRCIDRRFETGEIFIKWDETNDDEWLLLIYIKDNSPDKGIVIEDKSNSEKNLSHEFKSSEIFKASDLMVDSLTQLIARTRSKKT